MDYMIFYREVDLQHYIYSRGDWPIAINPGEKEPWLAPKGELGVPEGRKQLEEALAAGARTRLFVINKKRYHINNRGKFVSE